MYSGTLSKAIFICRKTKINEIAWTNTHDKNIKYFPFASQRSSRFWLEWMFQEGYTVVKYEVLKSLLFTLQSMQ